MLSQRCEAFSTQSQSYSPKDRMCRWIPGLVKCSLHILQVPATSQWCTYSWHERFFPLNSTFLRVMWQQKMGMCCISWCVVWQCTDISKGQMAAWIIMKNWIELKPGGCKAIFPFMIVSWDNCPQKNSWKEVKRMLSTRYLLGFQWGLSEIYV